ncbi:hypothetical protein FCT18_02040 [Lysinibacillus sphaericus]|uniref:Uncharacterized protein n=1 Tax=Lysinibacillus sphaericus TaxID=1421 RepID=A0A2S0K223_LYSSH|nr:hypothetical protein [Lysinibacillus sphaericus]AVK97430.1 hypothetical protein LS41612_14705 [Lysinibacillus sphaericus]MED4542741.1 hypothetical protein [Lysinibacillus sphaericus]TKI21194.1 hypothetical protein FCT18_02040 [Lysinibacillus sphaericus]SUV16669.1 Uncharacterised protein [Lysinibacillus sphaericus]GEC82705.1 hypothetical protein LSP03_24480 [Lysinibacillus sphaericus]
MKKFLLLFLTFMLAFTAVAPNLGYAANIKEKNDDSLPQLNNEPVIEPYSLEDKSEILEQCLRYEFINLSSRISAYSLPGDFTNLCRIIETQNRDNVTYNNWEQRVLTFLINGGVAVIVGRFTATRLRTFVSSGIASLFITIPRSQNLYTTIQVRECEDSTGINRYLVITYYSNSARTQQLYTHYTRA